LALGHHGQPSGCLLANPHPRVVLCVEYDGAGLIEHRGGVRLDEPGAQKHSNETPAVSVIGIRKTYGDQVAVERLSLEIMPGEFFTMLGPSGSGKTTTLRLIAGFERPDSGAIELHGQDVTNRPPYQRDVNTVFQDYALFPHMNVAENVGYGLKVKGVRKNERASRANDALAMVGLAGLGGRKPIQLSGGQRQRVALARSLVNRPRVLLLDEPLGALDLKLRQEMQLELKGIQRELADRVTFIYVTHDQDEALTMSDRIAVLADGRLQQVGTPGEVYEHPASEFVAGFVGSSNLIERGGRRYTIRPEKLHLLDPGDPIPTGMESDAGVVRAVVYLGAVTRYVVELGSGQSLTVLRQNLDITSSQALAEHGRQVRLAWRAEYMAPIDSDQEEDKE
jgi:putative spermidine/putrescine transport system ATP-binding protein